VFWTVWLLKSFFNVVWGGTFATFYTLFVGGFLKF